MENQVTHLTETLESLNELVEDTTVPRNVKSNVQDILNMLKDGAGDPMKISKALNILEEIGDDINLQSYTRTQICNVVIMLEKLQ